jgi:hypothetical protein
MCRRGIGCRRWRWWRPWLCSRCQRRTWCTLRQPCRQLICHTCQQGIGCMLRRPRRSMCRGGIGCRLCTVCTTLNHCCHSGCRVRRLGIDTRRNPSHDRNSCTSRCQDCRCLIGDGVRRVFGGCEARPVVGWRSGQARAVECSATSPVCASRLPRLGKGASAAKPAAKRSFSARCAAAHAAATWSLQSCA